MVAVPEAGKRMATDAEVAAGDSSSEGRWLGTISPDSSAKPEIGQAASIVASSSDDASGGVGLRTGLHEFSGRGSAAPGVSCRSWMVADASTGEALMWFRPGLILQPASITKVATALVVLELQQTQPDALRRKFMSQKITISQFAASFAAWTQQYGWNHGTNAKLKAGEVYSARELLYALLLPSGNDAAVALAEHFGSHFPPPPPGDPQLEQWPPDGAIARFVGRMNHLAQRIGLRSDGSAGTRRSTFFVSPHGMGNDRNVSCCSDLIRISQRAMQFALFRKVVATVKFRAEAREDMGRASTKHWANTNLLLRSGLQDRYDGVKTGWIPNVHCRREWGCLVTRVQRAHSAAQPTQRRAKPLKILVAVMGSASQDLRFADTVAVVGWAWRVLDAVAVHRQRAHAVSLPHEPSLPPTPKHAPPAQRLGALGGGGPRPMLRSSSAGAGGTVWGGQPQVGHGRVRAAGQQGGEAWGRGEEQAARRTALAVHEDDEDDEIARGKQRARGVVYEQLAVTLRQSGKRLMRGCSDGALVRGGNAPIATAPACPRLALPEFSDRKSGPGTDGALNLKASR